MMGNTERGYDALSGIDPARLIRVQVKELPQLFNSIDPSSLNEKDLDAQAEQFIVSWAKDLKASRAPLALEITAQRPSAFDGVADAVQEAVHAHFKRKEEERGRDLRELFRRGRISLAVGLVFLASSTLLASLISTWIPNSTVAEIVRQGLTVGGWVAMWRPLEIFLYAWWPITGERRLYRRLGAMPVIARVLPDAGNA